MQEISSSEPLTDFDKMSGSEKAILKAYKNHLLKDTPAHQMRELMFTVNDIHEKYPDFDMGQVP